MRFCKAYCVVIAFVLLPACARQNAETANEHAIAIPATIAEAAVTSEFVYDSEWNERNAGIYRHLLVELELPNPDRIYFITTTPMSEWGETGSWRTLPTDELKRFPQASRYWPANEAYLKEGNVLDKRTNAEAWMKWISVKRWISETQVEVEIGVWCCPLGGGASTSIYENVNGKWRFKERVESWIS